MNTLDTEQKEFLVVRNAICVRPVEIVKEFKETFGIDIGRSLVSYYDPNNAHSQLPKDLQALFWRTREAYIKREQSIPIAIRTHRLELLNEMLDHPMVKNFPTVAQGVLEQAAKEVGGLYQQRITGAKPEEIEAFTATLVGGIRQAIVKTVSDPLEQQRVLDAVSKEVERQLEEEG